jgi:hypothetical protein
MFSMKIYNTGIVSDVMSKIHIILLSFVIIFNFFIVIIELLPHVVLYVLRRVDVPSLGRMCHFKRLRNESSLIPV